MNKEIELLNNKIDAQDKIINTQALEIARLKEINNSIKEVDRKLLERIDKAIELTKNLLKTEYKGYYQIIFKEQLKVLGDKENE